MPPEVSGRLLGDLARGSTSRFWGGTRRPLARFSMNLTLERTALRFVLLLPSAHGSRCEVLCCRRQADMRACLHAFHVRNRSDQAQPGSRSERGWCDARAAPMRRLSGATTALQAAPGRRMRDAQATRSTASPSARPFTRPTFHPPVRPPVRPNVWQTSRPAGRPRPRSPPTAGPPARARPFHPPAPTTARSRAR